LHDPSNILEAKFEQVKGSQLKALEDRLDAVTCAYVASYLWRHGEAGAWLYGTVADGHIIVPRYPPEAETLETPP
jgi:predicted RNase H-like nuclease